MPHLESPGFSSFFTVEKTSHVVESAFARMESLAAIRDLKWHCTSWISPRLTLEEGQGLYTTLYPQVPAKGRPDGDLCDKSLCIGSSTITRAKVYAVFPHLQRDIRQSTSLLQKWHDSVIRPAFEQSWRQAFEGRTGNPKTPPTFDLLKDQSEAKGRRLHERNPKSYPEPFCEPVEVPWPAAVQVGSDLDSWDDCLDLAWRSMQDSVAYNSDLSELQDMFLVVVFPGYRVAGKSTLEAFQQATKHWECSIEPKYLSSECFTVYYKSVSQIGSARRFWNNYFG